jgi:hypothetical protein
MSFPARYDGSCPACDDPIEVGEDVSMVDSDRGRVTVHSLCAEDRIFINARQRVDHTEVMPRGKTARDVCTRCFMVPASNGICGCES